MRALDLQSIQDAAGSLSDRIHRTPLLRSATLSRLAGCEVYLKAENLQKTGSFKPRGALTKLERLSSDQRARGVVAASAGNHAQGLAYAADAFGVPCVVVMPTTAPAAKLEATRAYGAEVELTGTIFDDCVERAEEICRSRDMVNVHPCADTDVVAGAGTVGLEIVEELPDVDMIVVPVGGGGLISGITVAARGLRPAVRIYGVQPELAAPMERSLRAGRLVTLDNAASIADGMAGREVYPLTFDIVSRQCEDVILVSEQAMLDAILLLLTRCKLLTEASGSAAVAAVVERRIPLTPNSKVVCVLSGGNQDLRLLAQWIESGVEGAAIAH